MYNIPMELEVAKQEGTLGIAVSGGADSMSLLYAYVKIGQDLLVINVEHGIRGDASVHDTEFVRAYCHRNNLPFVSRSVKTPDAMRQGESLETCARRLRYAFFDELLASGKVQKIALAHHADDNVETILMHLFRGTGIHGLTGITDRDDYIHPLIRYTKSQILDYVDTHGIPYVTDGTNYTSDYTRNFIRNILLPNVSHRFSDPCGAITRLSDSAREADEYLSSVAPKATMDGDGCRIKGLFGYPVVLQKYAIMSTVKQLGVWQDFETRHLESVLNLAEKPQNTSIDLPYCLRAIKFDDGVLLVRGGEEHFSEKSYDADTVYVHKNVRYRFEKGEAIIPGITFDGDALPAGCVVRKRRDGDVFKRVNGKTKLLGDFLNGLKLSKLEKENLLVVALGSEVYIVLGLETSDKVKVTDKTTNILHVIKE